MLEVFMRVRKEYVKYNFDDGSTTEGQGIRIILAPRIEKFIMLENLTTGKKSNLELVEFCNPNLAQWYHNSPVGSELELVENGQKVEVKGSITDIYSKSENQL